MDEQGRYVGMFSQRNCWIWASVGHSGRSQRARSGRRRHSFDQLLRSSTTTALTRWRPADRIYFRNQPLGCTATIITQMYHEHNVEIEPKIAGLLCSAILSDTLMFRSPTYAASIAWLQKSWRKSPVWTSSSMQQKCSVPARVCSIARWMSCSTWFKYFQAQNQKIAISQVTSVSENELSGIRDKMLRVLRKAAWHRAVCPCCSLC